ncbi:F-box protein At3g08750-like [Solanum tuberosum]|uniref:Ubiquitin-protein ligase n=1 Tax=Solanum tuberosum TaxID=4113 RepID=M1CP31_SOLTU|nr:PREDICTED: F-box protein At3g08750-like [Solanum tuberosum]
MDSTQNVPHDIIIDILAQLPVKALIRFKGVCRSWYSLIKDNKFIKQHYDTHKNCQKYFMTCRRRNMKNQFNYYHYTMDVPQLDSTSTISLVESPVPIDRSRMVLGNTQYFSCNGILLIITYANDIVLWNPATKESRRIPCPIRSKSGGLYNFCYFPSIDSYKIFRLGREVFNDDKNDMDIDIFSTKGNSWKSVGMFPSNYDFLDSSIVMSDGIVYMMAKRIGNLVSSTILRFCLEKEQFEEELLCVDTIPGRIRILYSVGEKLCLISSSGDNNEVREIWLYMMTTNSWSKILTIPLTLRPLSFMEDGGMMFQKFNRSGFVFEAYNSTTHKFEQVNVTEIEGLNLFNRVVTYVETLSSPNS